MALPGLSSNLTRHTMKKILISVTSLLILTSCGEKNEKVSSSPPEKYSTKTENNKYYNPEHITFIEVDTPNGKVDCIWGAGDVEGSLSCNWEKFNQPK